MNFLPLSYLTWAARYYGQVRYDLATSGLPEAAPDWLPTMPPLDDYRAEGHLKDYLGQIYAQPTSEIVLTLGTSQALFVAMAALLTPGDRVFVEHPHYEPLWATPQVLGIEVNYFKRGTDWGLEAAQFRVLPPQTKLVVLSNPHNPTGKVIADSIILEIAEVCAAQGAYLLVDEVYRDFGSFEQTSSRQLHPYILAVSSLTKVYGLSWVRCGWLLAPEELAQKGNIALKYLSGNNPPATHALGLAALAQRETLWQYSQQRMIDNRHIIESWFAQQSCLTWQPPSHGLFGFFQHRSGLDLRPWIEQGLHQEGVLVVPGSFFGEPTGFRLAWGMPTEQLPTALGQLTKVLEAIP